MSLLPRLAGNLAFRESNATSLSATTKLFGRLPELPFNIASFLSRIMQLNNEKGPGTPGLFVERQFRVGLRGPPEFHGHNSSSSG